MHILLGVTGMFRFAFCASLVLSAASASADSATQSDWSGGPGTPGPVLTWGSDYSSDSGPLWFATVGFACLAAGVEHIVDEDFDFAYSICSGDVDGDGLIDVLGAARSADDIAWWQNAGGQDTAWIEHTVDGSFDGAGSVGVDDIDGDGDIDVLGAAFYADDIAWWQNVDGQGTTWIEHTIDGAFDYAHSVSSDDIDGDGDIDVLGAAYYADDVAWWENGDGLGTTWIEHTIDGEFNGARSVCSDDIDGDGDIDVLGAAFYADEVVWWENVAGQGTTWIEHQVSGSFDGVQSIHTDDIDGDGDIDAMGAASTADDIAWWENGDGLGTTWIEHTVDGEFDYAHSIYSDDIDGDGDIDLLGSSWHAHEIAWWENGDGLGTTWIEHTVAVDFKGACSACSDDIDGDGDIDVLGAANGAGDISWWDLYGYPGEAYLESSILDTGCDPDWGTLLWSAQTPSGTSVSFQVRASDDYTQMGDWSDTIVSPCALDGILEDNASYIQYRLFLTTADPDTTPTLFDVTVTWNSLGLGAPAPSGFELLPVHPNPCDGAAAIEFGIPYATEVELVVFDISGRRVRENASAEYQPGWHTVQLDTLRPGIYFIRIQAEEFQETQRFVVIE